MHEGEPKQPLEWHEQMKKEYVELMKKKTAGEPVDEKELERLRTGLDSLSREESEDVGEDVED